MAKLTARQERFCRRFVECANAAGAARAAGYAPRSARSTGYRLLREPAVIERITRLQVETARAHCSGVELLLGKLEVVFRQAVEDHQFATAARAIELQAKLAGLAPGRPVPTGTASTPTATGPAKDLPPSDVD